MQNPSFTLGLASWTVEGSTDFSVQSIPCTGAYGSPGLVPGCIQWSYEVLGTCSLSQTVQLPPSTASYLFSIVVGGGLYSDLGKPSLFSAQASFYDGDGVLLQTIGTAVDDLTTLNLTLFSWTTTESMIQARTAEISLGGQDGKYWAGYFGPIMGDVNLQPFQGLVRSNHNHI